MIFRHSVFKDFGRFFIILSFRILGADSPSFRRSAISSFTISRVSPPLRHSAIPALHRSVISAFRVTHSNKIQDCSILHEVGTVSDIPPPPKAKSHETGRRRVSRSDRSTSFPSLLKESKFCQSSGQCRLCTIKTVRIKQMTLQKNLHVFHSITLPEGAKAKSIQQVSQTGSQLSILDRSKACPSCPRPERFPSP